jgi:hypothetical protein
MSQMTTQQQSIGGGFDEEIAPKKITIQQPFNLTKPKPKVIPAPEGLPREVKANPIPKGMLDTTVEKVEKKKDERRKINTEAIRKEYEENPR